jgi:hypothetical protein
VGVTFLPMGLYEKAHRAFIPAVAVVPIDEWLAFHRIEWIDAPEGRLNAPRWLQAYEPLIDEDRYSPLVQELIDQIRVVAPRDAEPHPVLRLPRWVVRIDTEGRTWRWVGGELRMWKDAKGREL